MRLEQFLGQSAGRLGQNAAIAVGDSRHSYAELDHKSRRLAAALVDHGVRSGDRVVLFMDNSFEAVVAIFAVLAAGGVVTPVDPAGGAEMLAYVIDDSGARAVVTQARLASMAADAMRDAPSVRMVVLAGGDRAGGGDTCLSFEDVVGRAGPIPSLPPAGGVDQPALVAYASAPPGLVEPSLVSHREIADAIGDAVPPREGGDDAVLLRTPSIATAPSLVRRDGRDQGRRHAGAGAPRCARPRKARSVGGLAPVVPGRLEATGRLAKWRRRKGQGTRPWWV